MTGEKKSSEVPGKINVKRSAKLLSKTSKTGSGTISSPPKAAIATSSGNKDEVHRRRNHLNDILRRRSGDTTESTPKVSSQLQEVELAHTTQQDSVKTGGLAREAHTVGELETVSAVTKGAQKDLQDGIGNASKSQEVDLETLGDMHQERVEKQQRNTGADVASYGHSHNAELHTPGNWRDDELLRQNFDLRYKVAQLQDQLVSQESRYREEVGRAGSHSNDEDLRARLHATEKESHERLQQLLSLKSSISTMTRSDAQMTDSELIESFSHLANRIREWAISNYRRSKLLVENLPPETVKVLTSLTPAWASIDNSDRLALYQAIVSDALMQILEEPLCVGLSEAGSLGAIEHFAKHFQTTTAADYREWRRTTIRLLESNDTSQTLLHSKNETLHRIAQEIEHVLFTLTSVSLTLSAQTTLGSILNIAADLQRSLVLQKARYQAVFFRPLDTAKVIFNEQIMESISDDFANEGDDTCRERILTLCVFPCLQKYGDEQGETEVCNILVKARVCCGVG